MVLKRLLIAFLHIFPCFVPASGLALANPEVLSEIDLSSQLKGKKEVSLEAGQGLVLRLVAPPEGPFGERLLIEVSGREVNELKGGKFEGFLGLKGEAATYWIVSEYTGEAHCCGVYHFFGQSGDPNSIKFLGKTEGHNGGPLPLQEALVEREGALFFTDLDNRFDYFHESHAGSMLVNLPKRYIQFSPAGIKVNNLPFKTEYLKNAQKTQSEIEQSLKNRRARPPAILKAGFGSDFDNMNFSDELGQLLVKRTLYLLYAREDQTAWQTISRDVGRYYQTSQWVPELKAEIQQKIKESPY